MSVSLSRIGQFGDKGKNPEFFGMILARDFSVDLRLTLPIIAIVLDFLVSVLANSVPTHVHHFNDGAMNQS